MNKLRLIFLATCAASITGLAAFSTSDVISLRFVPAGDARAALEQDLGVEAASAILNVDSARNGIALDNSHPQAAKVRAFLAKLDKRPAQLMVAAVIKRHVEATADAPAHDVVIARPTVFASPGKLINLTVPSENGDTTIELRITSTPADKE